MFKRISFQYRITLLYIFFGALWILFSDQLVISLTNDPHRIHLLSTYKGWFFVTITGVLLFYLIRNEIRRRTLIYNELLDAKKKADESDRLKTNFLSNLSHYIRTPMNGILGFVELLEDKDISPSKHQTFLSYINERSQHLLQTLNSIIEISRIQEGLAKVTVQSFSANEMIDWMAETARLDVASKFKSINILTNYGLTNGDDLINTDRDKVIQIISNVLSNAVNFTQKGEIEISTAKVGDQVAIYVKDTGKGIAKERIETLFTGFLQNTSTTCIVGEGAGLGLPLSAGLAKLLGGKLWLENTGEKGSTFGFSIPANPS